MSKHRSSTLGPVFAIGVICVVSLLVMPPLQAWAVLPGPQSPSHGEAFGLPDRPATATPDLPLRPPTVTPIPTSTDAAAIELNVQFIPGSPLEKEWREDLWTRVQWQDGLGYWHVVEGWQASLDEVRGDNGRKIWYVSDDLFGRGPFCWVVYPSPESEPIAISLPFRMPSSAGVIVQADLAVGKPVPLPPVEEGSKSMAPVTGGEKRYTGLQVSLTVFLIVLLVGSLLFRGWRRRRE